MDFTLQFQPKSQVVQNNKSNILYSNPGPEFNLMQFHSKDTEIYK